MVTAIAVVVNTVFGIVCALVIVRGNIRGRGFLNAFVDLPLSLSPVIVGFSLLTLYGLDGWLGWFQRNGYEILFATPVDRARDDLRDAAVRRARGRADAPRDRHRAGAGSRRRSGRRAGRRSGGSRCRRIRWAVVYGVVLTAARAIGEFGAVAVVSGNFAGETQTATLRVEDAYQFAYGNYAPAYGISFVLAATAVIVLVAMILLQPKESRH